MTMMSASQSNTCPTWCVTEHGQFYGEEDHLHTGAGVRLGHGHTAHCALCATVDPSSGETDGPYIIVAAQEWTLEQARSIGHALIALTEQVDPNEGPSVDDEPLRR